MNDIMRYLLALVILFGTIYLFFLIPNPLEMIKGSGAGMGWGIIGLFLLPLTFAFYVAIVGILLVSAWNLIAYIFHEDEDEAFETKTPKSILTSTTKDNTKVTFINHPTDIKSSFFATTLKISSLIIGLSFLTVIFIYTSFGVMFNNSNKANIKKRYSTNYTTEDYNDSRIIFYNNALKESSQSFLLAESMYDIFEADAKREISLECIKVLRKEHNATSAYQADKQIKWFKQNAINHYTTNKKKIEKSVKNEKYLRKHSMEYLYPLSSEYGLHRFYNQMPNRCTETLSIDEIYKKFIPFYIQSQERKIDNYYITYNPKESILKRYKEWLKNLYEKYPEHSEKRNFY